jgi:hypothetical protein
VINQLPFRITFPSWLTLLESGPIDPHPAIIIFFLALQKFGIDFASIPIEKELHLALVEV